MYSLHLTAEQREIRDTVRGFVTQEVKPVALKSSRLEAGERRFPPEILAKASQMGLRTLSLPEARGGAGADNLTACIVAEELAAGDVDFAHTLAETSRLGRVLFESAMNDEQRERFLPQFIEDDSFHLSHAERESGSDTALGINYHRPGSAPPVVATTASRGSDGGWVINGAKTVVVNAPLARLFIVDANIDGRVRALLVPAAAPGMTVREPGQSRGWYHGVCGDIEFRDCKVSAANVLGEASLMPLSDGKAHGRGVPLKQAMNVGVGRAAYEAALDYAKLRIQGGRRIIEHQAIGAMLAECAVRLQVARNAVWQAAWVSDHPEAIEDRSVEDVPLQLMAESFTAEAIHRVALDAADVFGAMGVMRDMPLTKYVRDALVFLHSGNGAADTKLRIAETVAGFERG